MYFWAKKLQKRANLALRNRWHTQTRICPQTRHHFSLYKNQRLLFRCPINTRKPQRRSTTPFSHRHWIGTRRLVEPRHPSDIIRIPALNAMAHERVKYPTQKPIELLQHLICKYTSQPNNIRCLLRKWHNINCRPTFTTTMDWHRPKPTGSSHCNPKAINNKISHQQHPN